MRLQPKYYSDGKLRIRYYEGGRGETIVFFHGGGLEAKAYKENIEYLSRRHHVIAPDIPGFGGSDIPPQEWDFTDIAAYFKRFINKKKIFEYHLIGYSYGGGIALNLACIDSNRITSLLLCNCAGIPRSFTKAGFVLLILKEAVLSTMSIRSYHQMMLFFRIVSSFIKNSLLRKDFFRLYNQIINSLNTRFPDVRIIKAKTRIIWTYKDTFFSSGEAEKKLLLIPSAKMIKIKGTHLWILLKHREFERMVFES